MPQKPSELTPSLWFDSEAAAKRAMEAMMRMTKFDPAAIEAAAAG